MIMIKNKLPPAGADMLSVPMQFNSHERSGTTEVYTHISSFNLSKIPYSDFDKILNVGMDVNEKYS